MVNHEVWSMNEIVSANRSRFPKWVTLLCTLLWISGTALAPEVWAKKDPVEKAREKELKRLMKEQRKPMDKRVKETRKQNKALAQQPLDKRARKIQRQTEKENKKALKQARKGYKKLTKEMEKEQKARMAGARKRKKGAESNP